MSSNSRPFHNIAHCRDHRPSIHLPNRGLVMGRSSRSVVLRRGLQCMGFAALHAVADAKAGRGRRVACRYPGSGRRGDLAKAPRLCELFNVSTTVFQPRTSPNRRCHARRALAHLIERHRRLNVRRPFFASPAVESVLTCKEGIILPVRR